MALVDAQWPSGDTKRSQSHTVRWGAELVGAERKPGNCRFQIERCANRLLHHLSRLQVQEPLQSLTFYSFAYDQRFSPANFPPYQGLPPLTLVKVMSVPRDWCDLVENRCLLPYPLHLVGLLQCLDELIGDVRSWSLAAQVALDAVSSGDGKGRESCP